jgi:hypothetical protein
VTHGFRNQTNVPAQNHNCNAKEAPLAIYKLTSSIVVNAAGGTVLTAGSTVTDTGPGAQLPPNYIPNGCCDAQDADGVLKMWNAGPIAPTIDLFRGPPTTWWKPVAGTGNPNRLYKLTGALAAGLPPVLGYS